MDVLIGAAIGLVIGAIMAVSSCAAVSATFTLYGIHIEGAPDFRAVLSRHLRGQLLIWLPLGVALGALFGLAAQAHI